MLTRLLRALVLFLAFVGVGGLVVAIAGRVSFPFALEWMEGATLHHALRLAADRPIYAPPSAEFIANLYPPLSYIPMAVSTALFGPTLPAARIPSLLATLATLYFVARATERAGGGRLGGLFAAGLWGLGFGYGGAFHDLARVDAFFLLLVAAGAERLQAERARSALALFALSFFAKQHGLFFLVAATAWLAWRDLPRHLPGIAGAWGGTVALFLFLHFESGGWFTTYCFTLPAEHGVLWKFVPAYFAVDVFLSVPVLAFAAFRTSLWRWRAPRAVDVLLLAALAASALGRAHAGGFDNVLLPGFLLLVIVGAATIVPVLVATEVHPAIRSLVGGAVVVQTLFLFQSPTHHWPAPNAMESHRDLVRALRTCAHGRNAVALDWTLEAGVPFLHTMALSDLRETGDTWLSRAGTRALVRGLASSSAPGAIGVGARFPELADALALRYRLCDVVRAPRVTTGYQPEDVTIYARAAP